MWHALPLRYFTLQTLATGIETIFVGLAMLGKCDDFEQVRQVADTFQNYRSLFDGVGQGASDFTLEDKFFKHEVKINTLVFMRQFTFASFYSWIKLKVTLSK